MKIYNHIDAGKMLKELSFLKFFDVFHILCIKIMIFAQKTEQSNANIKRVITVLNYD